MKALNSFALIDYEEGQDDPPLLIVTAMIEVGLEVNVVLAKAGAAGALIIRVDIGSYTCNVHCFVTEILTLTYRFNFLATRFI